MLDTYEYDFGSKLRALIHSNTDVVARHTLSAEVPTGTGLKSVPPFYDKLAAHEFVTTTIIQGGTLLTAYPRNRC